MTEAEWLTSDNTEAMLRVLKTSDRRKVRLFACACCERIKHLFTERGANALNVAERFADGHATREELLANQTQLPEITSAHFGSNFESGTAACSVCDLLLDVPVYKLSSVTWSALATNDVPAEWRHQSALLRDIFGNPFRPVAFDPAWRTDTAVAVARQMYDAREFGAMPILADALQDAGCEDEHILAHCRDTSAPHVRGCWVVDLVLGKS